MRTPSKNEKVTITGQPFDVGATAVDMKLGATIEGIAEGHPPGVLDAFIKGAISALIAHHTVAMGAAATTAMMEKFMEGARGVERDLGALIGAPGNAVH